MGGPEKTMFVHMGEGEVRACPRGQKLFVVTHFLRMDSTKAARISKKVVYVNELLMCPFEQLCDEFLR